MAYVFITGIPASGKSFLTENVCQKTGAFHLDADTLRKEMSSDPKLKFWVDFFLNQNEKKYLTETSCEEMWTNLVNQSEAFWSTILEKINQIKSEHSSAIFEGVNILPHLAKRDLDFSGVVLLGESEEQIFERNKNSPRWGKTEELQKMEAKMFFDCERKWYASEAKKYGFKPFTDSLEAEQEVLKLLKQN